MQSLFMELGGRCPFCGGEVNIVEGMVYDYSLDKGGYPEFLNSEEYKVAGYCQTCCRQLFVLPNSNGGYTIYPDNPMDFYPFNYFTLRGRISVIGDRLLGNTDENINPFVNVREANIAEKENDYHSDLIEEDIPF